MTPPNEPTWYLEGSTPPPDDTSDWLVPEGRWWTMPRVQRAALLVFVRPLYLLGGTLADLRQALALRWPYRPFRPVGWLSNDPTVTYDEWHAGPDDCDAEAGPHGLVYERDGGVGSFVDRKSTRLNSSHQKISYPVFCLKKKRNETPKDDAHTRSPHDRMRTNRVSRT